VKMKHCTFLLFLSGILVEIGFLVPVLLDLDSARFLIPGPPDIVSEPGGDEPSDRPIGDDGTDLVPSLYSERRLLARLLIPCPPGAALEIHPPLPPAINQSAFRTSETHLVPTAGMFELCDICRSACETGKSFVFTLSQWDTNRTRVPCTCSTWPRL
jgi:hypothetical protein